jgi:hybrid cluster-associated redox disulfide protein
MAKVELLTKDTIIGDVLKIDIQLARFLMEIGMHCIGCPASRGETIEEACQVHGVEVDELLARMNAYLEVMHGAE